MPLRSRRYAILASATAACVWLHTPVSAQSTITTFALQSSTSTLSSNGYVGSYLVVPAGGATVNFTINATASAGATPAPHMNLAVADSLFGFTLTSTSASSYATPNLTLPAGTYFIRNERDYPGNFGVSRSFTVNNLSVSTVSGPAATFANASTDSNALSAANTYINNFRKGAVTINLKGPGNIPLLPGTPITADLGRHAFNFGGTVSGVNADDPKNMVGASNPAPGTEAYKFQQFSNNHFNTIVPSNAGKWSSNESTQNAPTMGYVDTILNYAQSHNMRARMHNLIWGSGATSGSQQPAWVNTLISSAAAGNATAKTNLRNAIQSRINYYVGTNGNRSQKYIEIDALNEALHNPSYWNIYGPSAADGIGFVHNQIAAAAAAAGAPDLRIYTNEYNLLQFSPSSLTTSGAQSGSDQYANWYRNHVEQIRSAGGIVSGIGFQYYANTTQTGSNAHSAATMQKALMNFSVEGLPLSLTEFGLASSTTVAQNETLGPGIMEDTMRMMFGTPLATTFMIWGWWDLVGNPRPPAALLDNTAGNNSVLTPMGVRWEQLMSEWDTNVATLVAADGAISFTGFFGDYYLRGQTTGPFDLTLAKGTSNYSLNMTAPPTWSLWNTNNSGSWATPANWTTGPIANAPGQTAYFGPAAAARTITVDSPRTIGMLAFNSAQPYTLSGAGALSLAGFDNGSGNVAAIHVAAGNHAINVPLTLDDDTTVTVPSASTLTATQLQDSTATLTKRGAGTLAVNRFHGGRVVADEGTVHVQPLHGVSSVTTLSINPAAALDLTNNDLIVEQMAFTQVRAAVLAGFGNTTGGITSSTSDGSQILALFDNAFVGASDWLGNPIGPSAIVGKYTYFGDANLDGQVSGDDYTVVDANLSSTPHAGLAWLSGDMNLDGSVSGDDYTVIDANLGLGAGNPLNASRISPVPEPAAPLLALPAAVLVRRRFRRQS